MGIFDRFKKKDIDEMASINHRLTRSFQHLKTDLDSQGKWITYLHDMNKKLHSSVKDLHGSHKSHKDTTESDVKKIKKWINYLYDNQKKQSKDLDVIEKAMQKSLERYNDHIIKLYKKFEEMALPDEEQLISKVQELLDGKRKEIDDDFSKIKDEINSVFEAKLNEIQSIEFPQGIDVKDIGLTNPEQKLLNLLLDEPDPISYSQIASKTGHSVNTIRVIMNTLKKKGLVDEVTIPNGSKLFNAKNKEKIKKLYNIESL